MTHKRSVYFLSDGTGLTVAALGRSLLSQFEGTHFEIHRMPFVDSPEKAREAVQAINAEHRDSGVRPLLFQTLVDDDIREEFAACTALNLEVFGSFIKALEDELGQRSSHRMGRSHTRSRQSHQRRSYAVDYALAHDDGLNPGAYDEADLVLIGVSRSGKTPTALYLAMQFGLCVANYPLTEDELDRGKLPGWLLRTGKRMAGLTLTPERLQMIRDGRMSHSRYASLRQCTYEINEAEALMRNAGLPIFETTDISVEEISTRITGHFDLMVDEREK